MEVTGVTICEIKYWQEYHKLQMEGLSQKNIYRIAKKQLSQLNNEFMGKYHRYELAACRSLLAPEYLHKLDTYSTWKIWRWFE